MSNTDQVACCLSYQIIPQFFHTGYWVLAFGKEVLTTLLPWLPTYAASYTQLYWQALDNVLFLSIIFSSLDIFGSLLCILIITGQPLNFDSDKVL